MSEDILEPLDAYNNHLRERHLDETIKYFEELTKAAGTDVAANREACKAYYKVLAEIDEQKRKLRRYKSLLTFSIICLLVGVIGGLILINNAVSGGVEGKKDIIKICIGIFGIIVGLIQGIIVFIKVRPILKKLSELRDKLESTAKEHLAVAYQTMATLNNLYDWNIPAEIINRTNELIEMDQYFDAKKYQFLHERYNLGESFDSTTSTEFVQSGSILGNPFMIVKTLKQGWYQHTYSNSITITWTTTSRDSQGRTHTVHHTQVLTATVTKPAPNYNNQTFLMYGNEAAPNLIFSRYPSGATGKSQKSIDKMVQKEVKTLNKKSERELMDNDPTTNYTRFGNDEFESLFGGENRNNELEYRLLFTPLAQRNLLKLIKTPEPYGDDFYFEKNKKINYVQSMHSQNFDYRANPEYFIDFDYDKAKDRFIVYNVNYFKNFFFDLAPLISIPLYQQTKTLEYIYKTPYKGNITQYENETMANQFDINVLKHPACVTRNILKTRFVSKNDSCDNVIVTANGFTTIPHVEYVNKWGGDGRMHTIPVEWLEYVAVSKETPMIIENKASSRNEWLNKVRDPEFQKLMAFAIAGQYTYERGLFAALLVNELAGDKIKDINVNYSGCRSSVKNNSNILNSTINRTFNEFGQAIKTAESKVKTNIGRSNNSNTNNTNNQGSN